MNAGPASLLLALVVAVAADEKPSNPFAELSWRNVGPAIMGGRVADVEGVPGDPRVVYAGAASGGVWKTTDGGITWKNVFDQRPSIGDIALEPGNPDVVYVGTGEGNLRNSVSFGDGVYKSTDGGTTFVNVGLAATRHISRIVVDPRNPERVFVGALGRSTGPNEDRGVYRSLDGGKSWERVLYLDERHGVSDLDIDPANPNILFAALWQFERKPWTMRSGSEEGGLYKSVDGGTTWKRIEPGLPKLIGRIGVKVAPSKPNVVYVIAESREGTLFRSDDHGESFAKVSSEVSIVSRGFYFADLRVDPTDENRVYAISGSLQVSIDGGKSFQRISRTLHSDYHSLWIDPENPDRMWQSQDGGVAVTYNRGGTWDYRDVLPIGEFYAIFADRREPFYYVGGGLQDNATWYGPSRNGEPFGILNDDFREITNGDGMQAVFHPLDPEITLTEYQGGRIVRTDNRTREHQYVSPYAPSMGGAPASAHQVRFHWNAPIVASPHDGMTVYFAGNKVFRTSDFGSTWETVSPDLTTNDPEKLGPAGGPVWEENTVAEYHCTIISFAESPHTRGILWAGTDDGNVQVSRDSGASWENVASNVKGVPGSSPVSHIEPSRTAAGTAWVSFDRHLLDDPRPYVLRTTDFGRSFVNATGDLPDNAYVWVLREDPRNPDLIYAGTELGLFATRDGGRSWERLRFENFPTVAVHDLLVHPRDNDLVVGTHGRGLWIFDDAAPIQQWSAAIAEKKTHLFPIRRAVRFQVKPTRYGIGDAKFLGPNPPYGALVTYWSKEEVADDATWKLEILDGSGEVIRTIETLSRKAGAHRVSWDLNLDPPHPRKPKPPATEPKKGGEEESARGPAGPRVPPGTYRVRLVAGDDVLEQTVDVVMSPVAGVPDAALVEQFEMAKRIWRMQSEVNELLQKLDGLESQIAERRSAIETQKKSVPETLEKALDDNAGRLDEISSLLAVPELKDRPGVGEAPRLSEKLSDLLGSVNSVSAAPTSAQREYLGELEKELGRLRGEAKAFFETVRELSRSLESAGVPGILLPEPADE
jgi:photosystem II stability/assembly factor-like uncharacterized protein